jgi:radical SAM superfamily enzyme YgiQ (UPF0313 family)
LSISQKSWKITSGMSKARKVVLINPNQMKPVVTPIALDYLGEALRKRGFSVDILDLAFERDFKVAIDNYFSGNNSVSAIGISIRNTDDCYFASQDFLIPQVKQVADYLKTKTSAPVIFGGVGFSVMPEAVLNYCQVDLGVRGEGEESFPLLIERVLHGKDYDDVPGVIYRTSDGFKSNPPQYLDLKKLPFFTRDFIDNKRYYREGGMGSIETKRGCEKSCIYCADRVAKGKKYRLRPPEAVVDEIEVLVKKGIYHFHLCDSEFNLPYEHAVAICEEIIRRGLGPKLAWYGYLSPSPFDSELAALMKRAGCAGIDFGVDSGCDEILKNLGRDFTVDEIVKTASICHRYEIVFMYDLLLGGPGETKETIRKTIKLMKKIKPSRVGLSVGVRIYPGTPLGEMVKKEGVSPHNPALFGKVRGNENFLEPIFYISPEVGPGINAYIGELIGGDERFFFASPDEVSQNYNYNENSVLVEAIKKGYRGAFWDILRKIKEE